jgi:hypothetical protein
MDPNATLDRIKELTKTLQRRADGTDRTRATRAKIMEELSDLTEAWDDLLDWLTRGGFAPKEWS